MAKRIQAKEQHSACEVCGRTMLRGEHAEPYLLPSRERRLVCELCAPRAQQEGWIRESAGPETPAQPPRPSDRRRFFRRRRRRSAVPVPDESAAEAGALDVAITRASEPAARMESFDDSANAGAKVTSPRDPRHVRAVPTNAELKIERAVHLFNGSEHPRTVAGISRTLGSPRVNAVTSDSSTAEVLLTIAWELSWYQFSVDLSDTSEPVRVRGRGDELEELPPEVRHWNAHAEPDGSVSFEAPRSLNSEHADQAI